MTLVRLASTRNLIRSRGFGNTLPNGPHDGVACQQRFLSKESEDASKFKESEDASQGLKGLSFTECAIIGGAAGFSSSIAYHLIDNYLESGKKSAVEGKVEGK